MPDVMGQRQNDDNPAGAADVSPVTSATWPNYLPAVIMAGVLAFIMAAVTVLLVQRG
jgi:hypothetical protein